MPTYEYRCKKCKHEFEEFQSMTAAPLTVCPKCKTPNLVRIIGSGAGMIFKGSGFYQTDYKGSSPGGTESASSKKTSKKTPTPPSGDTTPPASKPPDPSSTPKKSKE
jgi:putative FmdB family regulatory protein